MAMLTTRLAVLSALIAWLVGVGLAPAQHTAIKIG